MTEAHRANSIVFRTPPQTSIRACSLRILPMVNNRVAVQSAAPYFKPNDKPRPRQGAKYTNFSAPRQAEAASEGETRGGTKPRREDKTGSQHTVVSTQYPTKIPLPAHYPNRLTWGRATEPFYDLLRSETTFFFPIS